jgi:DNA topoisomerase-1
LPSHLAGKAIPPAWRNVQIAMNPKHHILAKGIDEKGRPVKTQADWFVKQQSEAKFARVREGIKKVDAIAKQNAGNLNSKDKTTAENAVVFRLIQHTGIRPGSDRDTKAAKQAYGATTLLGKHVVVDAQGKVSLHYTGKKGVDLNIPIHDKAIATDLLGRKWSAGSNGRIFDTTAAKLLAYSHSLDGGGFKTKDFRTIRGTMEAMNLVKNMAIPRSEAERKQRILEVAVRVSKVLGNTPAIALQSYIAPQVFSKWRSKA